VTAQSLKAMPALLPDGWMEALLAYRGTRQGMEGAPQEHGTEGSLSRACKTHAAIDHALAEERYRIDRAYALSERFDPEASSVLLLLSDNPSENVAGKIRGGTRARTRKPSPPTLQITPESRSLDIAEVIWRCGIGP